MENKIKAKRENGEDKENENNEKTTT